MDPDTKSTILLKIYDIYDDFHKDLDIACVKKCAHCCTRNVTLTTLEAYLLINHIIDTNKRRFLGELKSICAESIYRPGMTTNEIADRSALDEDIPDDSPEPGGGTCPMLSGDECVVYPARPFACRCMVSRRNCGESGFADMDDTVISMNTAFMQYIEHLDSSGGFSGNFADALQLLSIAENRDRYRFGTLARKARKLIPNHPLKTLMVPPEHRARVMPMIMKIQNIRIPAGGVAKRNE